MVLEQPRIITWNDLLTTVYPYIEGYPWALDTLGDLWRMGAPDPQSSIDTTHTAASALMMPTPELQEKRILLPSQFKKWWQDVCNRQGLDPNILKL
jgi:hypothetical protein